MTAEETPEQPGSDLTSEQKRKIVSFMRSDDRHVEIDPIKHFADWAVNYKRSITVENVQPVCEQLKDGQWPDDDAALRAWWQAGGDDEYRYWQERKRAEEIYDIYQVLLDSQSPVLKLTGGSDTPRTMTIAGYVVITEGYRLALDPDERDDCVTIHASELGAQDEVDERLEVQPNGDKQMSEIHPVTLTITAEPFVSEPLDRTESHRPAERPFRANGSPRHRLRAAFVERLLLVLAVLAAAGLGYWIAYLAHVDAAFARGQADAELQLRHIAEVNAANSAQLASESARITAEHEVLRLRAEAIAKDKTEHIKKLRGIVTRYLRRGRDELLGLKEVDADQVPGELFVVLRSAGEILRQLDGVANTELLVQHERLRDDMIRRLVEYLYPEREVVNVKQIFAKDDE